MTVSLQTPYQASTGNGVTTVFPFLFKVLSKSDLLVYVSGSLKVVDVDYTVSGLGADAGGSVTFTTAPANGTAVRLIRSMSRVRDTDYQHLGDFDTDTVNPDFDRAILIEQDLAVAVGRAIRAPVYEPDAAMELPIADSRLGKLLYFNATTGAAEMLDLASVGGISSPISASILGSTLWPRSSAEIGASKTPSDYSRMYVDVARFGATGDGTTDDTTAVQAALDVATIGYLHVHFPAQNRNGQTIYVVGKLSVHEGTLVTADEGVIIRSTITVWTDHVFECISTLGSGVVLSANTAKRDTTVTTASTTGLAAGMVVCLRDTQYKWSTNGRNLEYNEIDSISGAGPYTITLKNRLQGAYLTASTAEIVPVSTPARNIAFSGITVEVPSGKDGGAFYFQDAYGCRVDNCRSTGQKGQPGVQVWRSAYIRVQGGEYSNGQSQSTPGYGYGMSISQSSHNCEARGVLFKNVRECAISLGSRHCGYVDCVSVSSYDNAFNTHADGSEDCYFVNCHSYYARSKGFYAGGAAGQAADKRIRFIACEAHYSGYMGFWADGAAGIESQDISFERCKAYHYGDDTATSYGFYAFRSTRPRIIDCIADADGETNARALVKVEICTDAHVKRGNFRSATGGWGIIHANCTGVVIEDNDIANIGSNQGVYAESTASTSVYVRRNKVDNDVAFIKNANDVHEFNQHATKSDTTFGTTASVADGGTVTHSNVTTPGHVMAQASVSGEFVSVTAIGGTTFTVAIKKHDNTAGTSQTIYWRTQR